MQELEQRLLEAEQRAENAETQVTGGGTGETVPQKRLLAFLDPSQGHTHTHILVTLTSSSWGQGKPAVTCLFF